MEEVATDSLTLFENNSKILAVFFARVTDKPFQMKGLVNVIQRGTTTLVIFLFQYQTLYLGNGLWLCYQISGFQPLFRITK